MNRPLLSDLARKKIPEFVFLAIESRAKDPGPQERFLRRLCGWPADMVHVLISLAFIKLGIDRPEAVIDRAFVENHALVPKTAN